MDVDHVLLTRFNLPSVGVEEMIRAREGWLRERVVLFERYCLPSIEAQSGARPGWLVYLDPQSPPWLLDRMASHESRGVLTPLLRETVGRADLIADLRAAVPDPGRVLVTTNLDNDDALAPDFSARLRAVRTDEPRCAVYLVHGLIATGDSLYARTDRVNAFCSVRESWHSPVTAWSEYHNELGRHMPTVRLGGAPGWLQVVHGSNVSNRVRGRRVSPATYADAFPGLSLPQPDLRELVTDTLFRAPARVARDSGRAAARRAALRILGKDRYGDVKLVLSKGLGRS